MWSNIRNFLVLERPNGAKLLMACAAIAIVLMLMSTGGRNSPVAHDMETVARIEIWYILFLSYAFLLLYGVLSANTTARLIGSIQGTIMWLGLFAFHTVLSGVGPLRGVYLVFGLFSIWSLFTVYENIRIQREYGIDLTKMSHDMMVQFMQKYRK